MTYSIVSKIFLIHFFLVVIVCGSMIHANKYNPETAGEASLMWATFLLLDFPMSIIVMLTSGPGVVGIPKLLASYSRDWFFTDVIWPGLVFQIVGVINWILLIYLFKAYYPYLSKWLPNLLPPVFPVHLRQEVRREEEDELKSDH